MQGMLIGTLSPAGTQWEQSDASFDIITGTADVVLEEWDANRQHGCGPPSVDPADARYAAWVAETYPAEQGIATQIPHPGHDRLFLVGRMAQFALDVNEDLNELDEQFRSSPAAELCRRFAVGVGVLLANGRDTKWSVFCDDDDGVTLLAHSRSSKRQVSFEFDTDGAIIRIISIDEEMRRTQRECRISHVQTLRNAIEWMHPR